MANDALKERCVPESDTKRSFEAERHRHSSTQSRLKRRLQEKEEEVQRLKDFGTKNQSRIRELEQQLTAAKSESSDLKSEAATQTDTDQDIEMVGAVAEKGTEHPAAELENLGKQNAALKKEKESNKEIMEQQAQEIERLRPEDKQMVNTTNLAREKDTQQDLSDIELTGAAPQAEEAVRSGLATEAVPRDSATALTPESLSSSLMAGRTPISEMPGEEDRVDEKSTETGWKSVEDQEVERLEKELYDEMMAITTLEQKKQELVDSSKGLEDEISERQQKRQRKYERYMIRKGKLGEECTAKDFDGLADSFGASVSTKRKKTKGQIEAEQEYGDGQEEEEEL